MIVESVPAAGITNVSVSTLNGNNGSYCRGEADIKEKVTSMGLFCVFIRPIEAEADFPIGTKVGNLRRYFLVSQALLGALYLP